MIIRRTILRAAILGAAIAFPVARLRVEPVDWDRAWQEAEDRMTEFMVEYLEASFLDSAALREDLNKAVSRAVIARLEEIKGGCRP